MKQHTATRLDQLIHDGTAGEVIRLADGHALTVQAAPGAETCTEVYLHPGLDAPAEPGWEDEDLWELLLTAGDSGDDQGRLFYGVPAPAVRALIADHGGESPGQDTTPAE